MKLVIDVNVVISALIADSKTRELIVTLEPDLLTPAFGESGYSAGGHTVYALSTEDGAEQWAFKTGREVPSSPAIVSDTVYIGSSERLTRNGITTGLVSASPREWVQLVLSRFELEQAYDTVVTASDINDVAKPNPHIYERAASDVDVSPDESIAVEDSRHGIQAATDAGMYCIAFRGQGNADADLGSADEVVDTTDALQTSVVSLLNLSDATPEIEKS